MAEIAIPVATAILKALEGDHEFLTRLRRGIEKESLRVNPNGELSNRPHPKSLGSPLTHPNITTDFSEAQLELITDVHESPEASIRQLENIHRFVYQGLDDETLWASSMPCILGADSEIPVGRYGSSNIAMAKTVYRLGLGNRYGRLMQTISGIHYNFSVPEAFWPVLATAVGGRPTQDFQTQTYFGLIRNFRRFSWLLIYLFGASPAICRSFVGNKPHKLQPLDEGTLHLPFATSLRMGRLGYQSDAQGSLHISYNSLDQYARSMRYALTQPYPPYEKIGVKVRGEYQQLNTSLIQIENEFYGTIRPKRPVKSGERPLAALLSRGVEYVEVRCLDLNPFLHVGIDESQMRFIDTFLLYCLLADSPADSEQESQLMSENQLAVVERGRQPELLLKRAKGSVSRERWSHEILDSCRPLAELLDGAHGGEGYIQSWEEQVRKVDDPTLTPSARILDLITSQRIPFFRFTMNQSLAHKGYFDEHPLRDQTLAKYRAQAETSLAEQQLIENADTDRIRRFSRKLSRRRLTATAHANASTDQQRPVNFLAHSLIPALAAEPGHPDLIAGGFMGDFIKGPVPENLPDTLAEGVRLHRRIDAYSNAQPEIRASCARFPTELRRFAPIFVDVIADHLLATRWVQFCNVPLSDFTSGVYQAIEQHTGLLTDRGLRFFDHMVAVDLLAGYSERSVMMRSLGSLTRRLKRPALDTELTIVVERELQALEEDFLSYFPDLVSHARGWLDARQTTPGTAGRLAQR